MSKEKKNIVASVTISRSSLTEDDFRKLNREFKHCSIQRPNSVVVGAAPFPRELIIIAIELAKNLAYSGAYDLIKNLVLSILSKGKQTSMPKKTVVKIRRKNETSHETITIKTNIELNEKQKEEFFETLNKVLLKLF